MANPLADLSQLVKNGEKQVSKARALLLENCVKINQELENFADTVDGEHFASAQWKEFLGQSAGEIIEQFTGGKEWGGAVELALVMWAFELEIIIIQGDAIYKGATELEIKGAVNQAAVKELLQGPNKKKKRAFAILKQGHFHLATIRKYNHTQVFFDNDDEYGKALDLIVEKLKATQEVPPSKLKGQELTSWAQKAAAARPSKAQPAAAVQPNPKKTTVVINAPKSNSVKSSKSDTLCRNFEKSGSCSYGQNCNFKHDDSGEGKQRRKSSQGNQEIKKLHAEVKKMKKKLEAQDSGRSRSQNRGRSRSRRGENSQNTRSKSQSRSRASSKSRSRASSRSRSRENDNPWFEVPSRERQLRVNLGQSTRPATWRRSLPDEANDLVTWVEEKSKEGWAVIKCDPGSENKLFKLLSEDPKYEIQRRRWSRRSGGSRK